MSERRAALRALHQRLAEAANDGLEGAWVTVDIADRSRAALRSFEDDESDAFARHLAQITRADAPEAQWVRTAWVRHEGILLGTRAEVTTIARRIALRLTSHALAGRLAWLVVLTRIFPGNAKRTLFCDAHYDLAKLQTTSVVWVEPYPDDDWQKSQRYPTATLVQSHESA